MSVRRRAEKAEKTSAAPESEAEGASSTDDEFEILEVVGVNETENASVVTHPDDGETLGLGDHAGAAELEAALKEKERYHDLWLRQQADFENFKKRAERDGERQRVIAAGDLVRHLLPVLDNLERALQSSAGDDPMRRGIELIHQQMLLLLAKEGLQPIESVGTRFDPHRHEAVEMVDAPGEDEGMVLQEMQRGYLFKERLLRPALVKVTSARGRETGGQRAAAVD